MLGVPRGSDGSAIRAAYVALMKACHPDTGAGSSDSGRIAAINQAYSVLRDPRKKALHDLELEREARQEEGRANRSMEDAEKGIPSFSPRRSAVARHPSVEIVRRRRQRSARIAASVLLVAVASLGAILAAQREEAFFPLDDVATAPLPVAAAAKPADRLLPSNTPVDQAMIRDSVSDVAWIMRHMGPEDLIRYSRNCFGEFDHNPVLRVLDHCIAFDTVLAVARDTGRTAWPLPVARYFSGPEREGRHKAALGRFSADDDAVMTRRLEIQQAVVSAIASSLLDGPQRPQPAPEGSGMERVRN